MAIRKAAGQSLLLAVNRQFLNPPSHEAVFNFSFPLDRDVPYEASQELVGHHPTSESLSGIETPQLSFNTFRESSVGLSMGRWSPDSMDSPIGSKSRPLTPANLAYHEQYSWHHGFGGSHWQNMPQDANTQGSEASEALWEFSGEPEVLSDDVDEYGYSHRRMLSTRSMPQRARSLNRINPLLTKAVLSHTVARSSSLDVDEHRVRWPVHAPVTTASRNRVQTSEPDFAPCNNTMSSQFALPSFDLPLRVQQDSQILYNTPTLSGCDTRHVSPWSEKVYPVQQLASYTLHGDTGSIAECDRPLPRGRNRRRLSGGKLSSRGKTGMECESFIRQNEHACTVPGCVDKTGKPKRFKRSEHRKRHEKTVHGKDDPEVPKFACWVKCGDKVCGRTFSRNDNLKSHLFKTHGRRSPNQRNLYVATLDRYSEYCDFSWTGPLNKDGLPLGHPSWPEIRQ